MPLVSGLEKCPGCHPCGAPSSAASFSFANGLEKCPGCHPERSEGSRSPAEEILRCAQDDSLGEEKTGESLKIQRIEGLTSGSFHRYTLINFNH